VDNTSFSEYLRPSRKTIEEMLRQTTKSPNLRDSFRSKINNLNTDKKEYMRMRRNSLSIDQKLISKTEKRPSDSNKHSLNNYVSRTETRHSSTEMINRSFDNANDSNSILHSNSFSHSDHRTDKSLKKLNDKQTKNAEFTDSIDQN
jgi:hypothetical protein